MGRKACPTVEANTCRFIHGWIIRRGSEGWLHLQYCKARLADFILAVDGDFPILKNYFSTLSNGFSICVFPIFVIKILHISIHYFSSIGQGSPTKISRSDPPNGKRTLDRQENGQSIQNSNPTLHSLNNI